MLRLRAMELLEQAGKSKYWLYKQMGMSYQNFNKMMRNETKSIQYRNIEVLCQIFHCTPSELFELDETKPE